MTTTQRLDLMIDMTFATTSDILKENSPKFIVLHSTDNYETHESLHHLHTAIYRWAGIGYHVFIANGKAYQTRDFAKEGAHCLGLNFNSIGLCVFSRDDHPSPRDLELGKEVISDIRSLYGHLPVISHTHAQIRYINKLYEKKGLTTDISEEVEISSQAQFTDIKERLAEFSNQNKPETHHYLQSLIERFKNCPGEEFYDFIRAVNEK